MQVKDRRMIARLMAIKSCSNRCLAEAGGWKSHSYVGRILRGEVTTVTPERAARVARHLEVGIDDLFMTRLSTDTGQSAHRRKTA